MQCIETPNTATAWNPEQVNAPHKTLHKEQTKQTAALTSCFNPPFNVYWCYIDLQTSLTDLYIIIITSALNHNQHLITELQSDLFSIHISVSENTYSVSSVFQKVHSCLTEFLPQFCYSGCSLIHLFCYLQSLPSILSSSWWDLRPSHTGDMFFIQVIRKSSFFFSNSFKLVFIMSPFTQTWYCSFQSEDCFSQLLPGELAANQSYCMERRYGTTLHSTINKNVNSLRHSYMCV